MIEKLVAFIAPEHCICCGSQNNIICDGCLWSHYEPLESFCALCTRPTTDWRLCMGCVASTALQGVSVATKYEDIPRQLIQELKFNGTRTAAKPLASLMYTSLPYLESDWVLAAIPSAPHRVRQRGYDHVRLLTRALQKQLSLPHATLLGRLSDTRQVGANRAQRLRQAEAAFYVRSRSQVAGKRVLLVDDVCTTGATLRAAANAVEAAGAQEVRAVVACWQPLEKST